MIPLLAPLPMLGDPQRVPDGFTQDVSGAPHYAFYFVSLQEHLACKRGHVPVFRVQYVRDGKWTVVAQRLEFTAARTAVQQHFQEAYYP